jgi:hypothetical protein
MYFKIKKKKKKKVPQNYKLINFSYVNCFLVEAHQQQTQLTSSVAEGW